METTVNLKRRRDSGENQAKKLCTQPNLPPAEKEPQVASQEPPEKSPFFTTASNHSIISHKRNPSKAIPTNQTTFTSTQFEGNYILPNFLISQVVLSIMVHK